MRLVIALVLNALLLAALGWWLRREHRLAPASLRPWLLPALAWRLLLTGASIYAPTPDGNLASFYGRELTARFWANPGAAISLWSEFILPGVNTYGLSNTLFIIKVLGVLNIASGSSQWLNTLYVSLFCFVGCWLLARVWVQLFPATPPLAAVVALLLWPSVVWWTAGINKETILVGSEAALVAVGLRQLYGPRLAASPRGWPQHLSELVAGLVLAWLAYRMRYFFALPLVGGLLVLAAVRWATQRNWLSANAISQGAATLVMLGLGGWLGLWAAASQVSEGFYTQQLYGQYVHGLATSVGRPHLEYAHLAPVATSLLRYAPAAVAQVLARPWLGEAATPLYGVVALENLVLLGLLGLAVAAGVRGRGGRLPVALVVVLILYCLLVAAFIGLSTPNLGTLHRYRAALLPWFLLLVLQNDYARQAFSWLGRQVKKVLPRA